MIPFDRSAYVQGHNAADVLTCMTLNPYNYYTEHAKWRSWRDGFCANRQGKSL